MKWLESERFRLLEHGAKQLRDTTLDKRDFDRSAAGSQAIWEAGLAIV